MARWRWTGGIGLSAALVVGCGNGGQTGQPTSEVPCLQGAPALVPPDEGEDGISAAELAHAFEGEYHAVLRWEDPSPTGAGPSSPLLEEDLTLTLTYAGASGRRTECELGVSILLEAVTADTGASEAGSAELWAPRGSSAAASLDYGGAELGISAALERSGAGNDISGVVAVLAGEYPAATATFSTVGDASDAARATGTAGTPSATSIQSETARAGGK